MSQKRTVTRKDLYDQAWSQPLTKLAKLYGITDSGLRKKYKQWNIPVPTSGYWQKREHGKEVVIPSLPGDGEEVVEIKDTIRPVPNLPLDQVQYEQARVKIEYERLPENKIIVQSGNASTAVERAHVIWDRLFDAFKRRDFLVKQVGHGHNATVSMLRTDVSFSLSPKMVRVKKELSEREKKWRPKDYVAYTYVPSDKLILKITNDLQQGGLRTKWSDTLKHKIEDSLNDFIIGLIRAAVRLRSIRLKSEKIQLEKEERERKAYEEKRRIEKLENNIERWKRCCEIREFILAIEKNAIANYGQIDPESELGQFLAWGRQYADRLDPLR